MGSHEETLVASEAFETGTVVTFLTDSLLDPVPVEAVRNQMAAALAAGDSPNLIVELASIELMGSVMLSVLIALRDDATARGGKLCLAAVPDRVKQLLELTKLQNEFPTYASAEEALADLR